ncbi:MAG: hypothetical protein SFY56_08735 [Bacteroidota bacterium]|nr:hypothetical protein [Bacteroidota bacterium]
MTEKKTIPVKYFYYGMLICALLITSLFFFLWQREANAEKALNERGIKANAWIIKLYETKVSKNSSPNYYMEVGFFADTTKKITISLKDTVSKVKSASEKILESFAKQTESLKQSAGDYETQTIQLVSYQIYKNYKINDKVRVQFLPEDHSVIRLTY